MIVKVGISIAYYAKLVVRARTSHAFNFFGLDLGKFVAAERNALRPYLDPIHKISKETMLNKISTATFAALLTLSHGANAASSIGVGVEDYHWLETIDGSSLSPEESGLRYAIHAKWAQDRDHGLLFGYRGKLYAGRVHYDTFTQQTYTPIATTTEYSGATHEGQLSYRSSAAYFKLDYVAGLGLDTWQRNIDNNGYNQIEDFLIIYLRGGLNLERPAQATGWHGGGGVKYPIFTREDAHLDRLGYTSNPTLSPGKDISLYAELGYRINQHWDVSGYYDSWRFKRSATVTASRGGMLYGIYQPESSMAAFGLKAIYSF